jgi:hypothetical protein
MLRAEHDVDVDIHFPEFTRKKIIQGIFTENQLNLAIKKLNN